MLRKILKLLLRVFYQPFVLKYLQKDHFYKWHGIKLLVKKGVFNPRLYQSNTKIFLKFLKNLDFEGKTFLEVGSGSGLISLFAAKRGAEVTATDISGTAVENIALNSEANDLKMRVLLSDLFEKIPKEKYDFIIITPPYFKAKPRNERDYGWFAGENLEYFSHLFRQLPEFIFSNTKVFMILSEACNLDMLKSSVETNNLNFKEVYKRKILLEKNTIYEIS
jgi:release factor glutamine methyltransferase